VSSTGTMSSVDRTEWAVRAVRSAPATRSLLLVDHGCDIQVRTARAALILTLVWLFLPTWATAQEPPPKIGPFVFDLHGTVPRFPDDPQLAQSRDLMTREMPGAGFGIHASANVYVYTWKAVTFGLGGDVAFARAHHGAELISPDVIGRGVT